MAILSHIRTWRPTARARAGAHAAAVVCLIAVLIATAEQTSRAADVPTAFQVRAAFLLNFTKFVEWPQSAFGSQNAPINICILGDNPFGTTLDELVQGETVQDHKLSVQKLSSPPTGKTCQVVYSASPDADPSTMAPNGADVLTVGEGEQFLKRGGIIRFLISDRRVRFDVNMKAAEKAGLKLSSRLLSVARTVEK